VFGVTFAEFSIACAADPKWIQNAARLLGWRLRYGEDEARHVGLVKQLQDDVQLPLSEADQLAGDALKTHGAQPGERVVVGSGRTGRVAVDLARYLSDFSVRLAQARTHEPRRRGRRRRQTLGAVESAREHGWDIGLLEASLRSTPADRIRRLDENIEFVRALRGRR
jgi:hypothetical protein